MRERETAWTVVEISYDWELLSFLLCTFTPSCSFLWGFLTALPVITLKDTLIVELKFFVSAFFIKL